MERRETVVLILEKAEWFGMAEAANLFGCENPNGDWLSTKGYK